MSLRLATPKRLSRRSAAGAEADVSAKAGRSWLAAIALALVATVRLDAHDLERTRVALTFARDGSFVLDVENDPNWLRLRLESFRGPFSDRVVLWVDGREVRPTSVEYLSPGLYRMRGRMPLDARTLRWYYGLVIDPYPMIVRRADGRVAVHEIAGDAWSETIDLSGQFRQPLVVNTFAALIVVAVLLTSFVLRIASASSSRKTRQPEKTTNKRLPFRGFVLSRFRG
jgi:hypothetical protein